MKDIPEFITVREFYKRFSSAFPSKRSVYRAVECGYLEHRRIGTKILIDVAAFLQGQKQDQRRDGVWNSFTELLLRAGFSALLEQQRSIAWTTNYDALVFGEIGTGVNIIEAKSWRSA